LEDPERRSWTPLEEIIRRFALAPGMVVADVGAGSGFFTLPIAHAILPGGIVWAVDLEPEMLQFLGHKLETLPAPHNVELLQGDATHTGLHSHTCDRVMFANLWHEVHHREAALREARRLLKPDGRIGILDWRPGVGGPPGPPQEERVPMEQVVTELKRNGWRVRSSTLLEPYSYFVVADVPPVSE
jgi:ubiquinone/menaquinone biosynthesis C-methylase UbiE